METLAIRNNITDGFETLLELEKMGATSPKLESCADHWLIKVQDNELDKFKYKVKRGCYR